MQVTDSVFLFYNTHMNLFAISGLLIGISSIAMAILMFAMARQRLHYIWSAFCVSVAFWGFGAYFIAMTTDATRADFWWRITHIGVILIPIIFTHFIYEYLHRENKKFVFLVYMCGGIFLWVNFSGNLFIANMRWVFDQFYYDSPPGILYIPFTVFFLYLIVYDHVLLWKAMQKETGLRKAQIQYFLGGMLISFAGGSLSFLPVYHIDLYPLFNTLAFLYTPIITYAIIKTRLFDVRILLTQILVAIIAFLLLINLVTATSSFEYLWKGMLFAIFLLIGYILIRSIMREIDARENIERLAEQLQRANTQLELVNKTKSDFLSIASHQLKTPLSIVKGYLSMATEGSFGKLTDDLRTVINKVYISNERLISLVEDLLNLSRIEDGHMKYEFTSEDLGELVTSVVNELKIPSEKRGLKLIMHRPKKQFIIQADKIKMRNVIFNLVDNAIKYTKKGEITVSISRNGNNVHLGVSDTGIGIPRDKISKLFAKFERLDEGHRNYSMSGFGLGLYITKLIIEAHKGRVWAESAGLGKGSTFVLELPLVELEKSKKNATVNTQNIERLT